MGVSRAHRLRSAWHAFRGDDTGSATVEACIWIPFFVAFFILILDAAFIFLREADAQRIVQDGTRQFVTGAIETRSDLEAWLEAAMQPIAPSANAGTSFDATTGMLTAWITYDAEDTDLTGATGALGWATMRVQSVQLTEQ